MANSSGGVGALAESVSARRRELDDLDIGEINGLTETWGTSLDLFGVDPKDPVVGGTVLVMAKMLAHRVASLVEFGNEAKSLEPALYVTGEAALVGLNLLEKSGPRRPPRMHRLCAGMAALALVVSALVGAHDLLSGPAADKVTTSGVVAITTPEGKAWIVVEGTIAEAGDAVRAYRAGERDSLPATIVREARLP